jgi:hypothetical protein
MNADRDTSTPLIGIEISSDPEKAREQIMEATQSGKEPCFWVAKPRRWLLGDDRPEGTRPHPNVALVDLEHFKAGRVELRYKDGLKVAIMLDEVAKGMVLVPGEVAERWVVCEAGEKDLKGRMHQR